MAKRLFEEAKKKKQQQYHAGEVSHQEKEPHRPAGESLTQAINEVLRGTLRSQVGVRRHGRIAMRGEPFAGRRRPFERQLEIDPAAAERVFARGLSEIETSRTRMEIMQREIEKQKIITRSI